MAKQPSPNLLLQRERMRHFLTQSELAEIIGVATKTVQRWELGLSRPRAYYMRKLCDYFGKKSEALRAEHIRDRTGVADKTSARWCQEKFRRGIKLVRGYVQRPCKLILSIHQTRPKVEASITLHTAS